MSNSRTEKTGVKCIYKRNCAGTNKYYCVVTAAIADGKRCNVSSSSFNTIDEAISIRKQMLRLIDTNKKETGLNYCTYTLDELKSIMKNLTPTGLYKPKLLASKISVSERMKNIDIRISRNHVKSFLSKVFVSGDDCCMLTAIYINPFDFYKLTNPVDLDHLNKIEDGYLHKKSKPYKLAKIYTEEELNCAGLSLTLENTNGDIIAVPIVFTKEMDINAPILSIVDNGKERISKFLGIKSLDTEFNLITGVYIPTVGTDGVPKDSNIYGTIMYTEHAKRLILSLILKRKES